ncbi:bifunctional 3-(3-hydroxy-phenyl)propionate/3-hydroxycinnamic acid hydroxylase [Microbaculum marinisediminis]|uniref:Bifunctional 3-(3-hydroxy-phenyl)propionate/3-hydroxycinnamic acid hydroxylase n=1 Tax=Microbaculum marinisediminis TaxID=2931392 RepID=A0AAW5R299_9HYPH|nr:bifunctional 3-(3-hydroxy-phenyl)propionate/3-hydroxycinnamic acid hydroxylase [Microbaculum sp. A6E488]MCT8973959.1 bifunctional 3-(3-hydroxy-phenyl)propionate/3-hydroxycinnamic acid hydroxylase [Microbaculum sp. A6E488]
MAGRSKTSLPKKVDVAIVGAGPVGLTIANFLGARCVSTLVLEQRDELIDYPRGVGMDDECLRSFQAIGLADAVAANTTPDQKMRFVTMHGQILASIEPKTRVFGWPRRNSFIQPMVDRILYSGLDRFDSVTTVMGAEVTAFQDRGDSVSLDISHGGKTAQVEARWLVGCDGGRSMVRKELGIDFEGVTDSTRWVVIDLHDDPIGRPGSYLHCVPERPYVSIALPHGKRRVEFMVFDTEAEETLCSDEGVRKLLARVMPRPEDANVMRSRVYTHNARLARQFQKGRVFIAGDAAHLMPVWQGQGYNSGIRDATNLGWKLAMVAKGEAREALLDSYGVERRDHAKAMIDLSVTAGKIFSPTSKTVSWLRDKLGLLMNAIPPVKRYFVEMRFKPMPRYRDGVVMKTARGEVQGSATGKMFPQPNVLDADGARRRLDDVLGLDIAILSWGNDPQLFLKPEERERWSKLGARFFAIVPETQHGGFQGNILPGTEVLSDTDGALHEWFADQGGDGSVVFLRPDRFVAGIAGPQDVGQASNALLNAFHAVN